MDMVYFKFQVWFWTILSSDPRSNTLSHEPIALVLEVLGFNPFKSEFVTCLTWVED